MTNCKQVKHAIRAGDTAKWSSHLTQCDDCRLFSENISLLDGNDTHTQPDMASHSSRLFNEILIETQKPSLRFRLAALPSTHRLIVSVIVVLCIAALLVLFKRRVDFHIYPSLRLGLELLGMGGLLALHMWLIVRPMHRAALNLWKRIGLTATTVLIVALPIVLPMAHHAHPESLKGVGDDLVIKAFACFTWGTVLGAALTIPGRLLLRGGKKSSRVNIPLLLAGAILALFSLHLHCPIVHPLHISLGHSSIMVGVWAVILSRRFLNRT